DLAGKQVKLEGPAAAVDAASRLVQILDVPPDPAGQNVHLMPVPPAQMNNVRRAAALIRTASGGPAGNMPLAALLMQRSDAPAPSGTAPGAAPPPTGLPPFPAAPGAAPDLSGGS